MSHNSQYVGVPKLENRHLASPHSQTKLPGRIIERNVLQNLICPLML